MSTTDHFTIEVTVWPTRQSFDSFALQGRLNDLLRLIKDEGAVSAFSLSVSEAQS